MKNPYEKQMQKALKQLEVKAMSGDIMAIMTLKYNEIAVKVRQVTEDAYNSKHPDVENIIKSFDIVLQELNKLMRIR